LAKLTGRIAGIDFGTKRIGVAVADAEMRIASPYENYNRRTVGLDADYFKRLAREERIVRFVVGLPVHLHGGESQKSAEARLFGAWLHEQTGVEVIFYDERFTSSDAEQFLMAADLSKKKRKARLDKLAAQIMLANYLEVMDLEQRAPGGLDD